MSRLFGPIRQNGYVVRDIEAAMKHWIEVLQVGPWFYIERVQTDWFRHRGQDSAVEMSIALANAGDLQIELIQQRNDGPSMYKEFLDSGREGLQHVAFWSTDYQALYDRAIGQGYKLGHEGQIGGRSPWLQPVHAIGPVSLTGTVVEMKVTAAHTNSLTATLEQERACA